jgi:hypothetical protein
MEIISNFSYNEVADFWTKQKFYQRYFDFTKNYSSNVRRICIPACEIGTTMETLNKLNLRMNVPLFLFL